MKNIIGFCLSFLLLLFGYGIANTGTALIENLDMSKVQGNQINKISLNFCNDGLVADKLTTSFDLSLRPNQKKDVCIVLTNKSDVPLTVLSAVVPGKLNENGNVLCENSGSLVNGVVVSDFSQFSGELTLKPQEQAVKYFTLKADSSASGKYYGCYTVNLNTVEKLSETSPFLLVIRKSGEMRLTITGDVYNWQWFDDIKELVSTQKMVISQASMIIGGVLIVFVIYSFFRSKNAKSKKHEKK